MAMTLETGIYITYRFFGTGRNFTSMFHQDSMTLREFKSFIGGEKKGDKYYFENVRKNRGSAFKKFSQDDAQLPSLNGTINALINRSRIAPTDICRQGIHTRDLWGIQQNFRTQLFRLRKTKRSRHKKGKQAINLVLWQGNNDMVTTPVSTISISYRFYGTGKIFRSMFHANSMTLGEFKSCMGMKDEFRYYFKKICKDRRMVYKAFSKDDAQLPLLNGRITAVIRQKEIGSEVLEGVAIQTKEENEHYLLYSEPCLTPETILPDPF